MATFLLLCPTHRDRRELALLEDCGRHRFLLHEYGTTELENMIAPCPSAIDIANPLEEIERIVVKYGGERIDGVVSTDDYPGSALAAIAARELRLPGVPPAVSLICQHKYYSRLAQREVLAEVVPEFALLEANTAPKLGLSIFPQTGKSVLLRGRARGESTAPSSLPAR